MWLATPPTALTRRTVTVNLAYTNTATWTVQQYKLSFELVNRGRPYAKGHKHDLEMIAAKLNELAEIKAQSARWVAEGNADATETP
jgi:hypothetical protein